MNKKDLLKAFARYEYESLNSLRNRTEESPTNYAEDVQLLDRVLDILEIILGRESTTFHLTEAYLKNLENELIEFYLGGEQK